MPPGAEGARWRRDVRNEKEQWRRRGLKKLKRTGGSCWGPAMRTKSLPNVQRTSSVAVTSTVVRITGEEFYRRSHGECRYAHWPQRTCCPWPPRTKGETATHLQEKPRDAALRGGAGGNPRHPPAPPQKRKRKRNAGQAGAPRRRPPEEVMKIKRK